MEQKVFKGLYTVFKPLLWFATVPGQLGRTFGRCAHSWYPKQEREGMHAVTKQLLMLVFHAQSTVTASGVQVGEGRCIMFEEFQIHLQQESDILHCGCTKQIFPYQKSMSYTDWQCNSITINQDIPSIDCYLLTRPIPIHYVSCAPEAMAFLHKLKIVTTSCSTYVLQCGFSMAVG